ncbi:hypothetical protein HHI36_014079 [Cryptolaemus montrouzieri]|uniref:Uncharacterized protein n=1 Tax=Cryptolaemus montrouzieri TaxID=559131 RepID=A0ABD2N1R0_9CUCU
MVKQLYEGATCKGLHNGHVSDCLEVKTGVRLEPSKTKLSAVAFTINDSKIKSMRVNTINPTPFKLSSRKQGKEVQEFTYLESIILRNGDADADIKNRIRKAQQVLVQLGPIWSARHQNQKGGSEHQQLQGRGVYIQFDEMYVFPRKEDGKLWSSSYANYEGIPTRESANKRQEDRRLEEAHEAMNPFTTKSFTGQQTEVQQRML